MNNLRNKLYKFLYGRYGIDELYKFGVLIYFILVIINIIFKSSIISLLETLLFILIMYRTFSKNHKARKKENEKYLSIKKKFITKIKKIQKRWSDRNTHMYKKCPKCKKTLRLPLKKGTHTVKCPNCENRFQVKCRKNEKIKVEIIKNKKS